ncbi:hypothetical protein [Halococcoides cellulosivorans]|uniref:hypothetical protein n=1 Tax=Halococcoides cellulosivorans TaxID=1679096 RepID=UPI00131EF2BC|nr:hypothetical protein [Halococcoides cellulosivorans]
MTKEEYNRHWDDYDGPGQKIPFNTMEKLCGNIADEVEEGRLVPRGRVSTTSVSTDSPPSLEINNDILEKARQGNNSNRGGNGQ